MGRRMIDADKLIELIDDDIASLDKNMTREGYDVCLCTLRMVKQYINVLPTVEPIRHGRWIEIGHPWYECSECGERTAVVNLNGEVVWNYCPNCGCSMREDDK